MKTMMFNHSSDDLYGRLFSLGKVGSLGSVGNMACGIFLCIVGTLSICGNGLVILVLYRSKKLRRKPHNMLLLNMATADIAITVCGYPFTTISAFYGHFPFGSVVCSLQGFLTFLMAMVAMTSLVFLSLYRYVAVCRPWLKYRITKTVSVRILITIWVYSIFWTGLPLIGWNRYTLETFGLSCSVDWTSEKEIDILYIYCLIVFCYLLPTATMCWCYYRIVKKAVKLRYVQQRVLNIEEATKHHNLRIEVQLSGMCFAMVFFFTTVWSPYAIVSLWSIYDAIPLWTTTLPTMFAKLASTLNPYIYAIANPEFRRSIKSVILACGKKNIVDPHPQQRGSRGFAGAYTIDRTKDGIYIGQRQVVINSHDFAIF